MSNALAIAAVTATLRDMLTTGIAADLPPNVVTAFNLGNTQVTTKPPDKARGPNDNFNQINLFLYQTNLNGALRNMDMPRQVKQGETGHPPAALDLYYLVTAMGQDDDDTRAHILLGQTVRIFHDRPVLSRSDIQAALVGNDLHEQVERVRITTEPLSAEEVSKLWAAFQTQYRISTAYKVSVVLIESERPSRTPLPVLTRGPNDEGVIVQPILIPPFPTLEEIILPNDQPSAHPGDVLTLRGHHLDGANVDVRFASHRLSAPIEVAANPGATATEIQVTLPDDPPNWPVGMYTVMGVITKSGEPNPRVTNELSFSLAPEITSPLPMSANVVANGDVSLALSCKPEVRPEQRAVLLLGSRGILAVPHPAQTNSLTFEIEAAPLGEHFIRLRIDGVDSLMVDRSVKPPVFLANQKVTIT
ncbi:MAG: DUF4255 domain-containing protein [Planctomycetes bacterium]|nr:DUF4255 domain-containing protein [Planctomycetota bacterium]